MQVGTHSRTRPAACIDTSKEIFLDVQIECHERSMIVSKVKLGFQEFNLKVTACDVLKCNTASVNRFVYLTSTLLAFFIYIWRFSCTSLQGTCRFEYAGMLAVWTQHWRRQRTVLLRLRSCAATGRRTKLFWRYGRQGNFWRRPERTDGEISQSAAYLASGQILAEVWGNINLWYSDFKFDEKTSNLVVRFSVRFNDSLVLACFWGHPAAVCLICHCISCHFCCCCRAHVCTLVSS